ncbi:MAG TPA: hypothetical protein VNI54_15325 [Thermoanaerobaculia bacterium]|nr:hypothetical protein [Thermoanaerobaculia bacterium]
MLAFVFWLLSRVMAEEQPATPADFQKDVRPILERRCQPCHFEGGKMYASLPFDKPATVTHLGEKLFTRIKDREEQAVIRAFLTSR